MSFVSVHPPLVWDLAVVSAARAGYSRHRFLDPTPGDAEALLCQRAHMIPAASLWVVLQELLPSWMWARRQGFFHLIPDLAPLDANVLAPRFAARNGAK